MRANAYEALETVDERLQDINPTLLTRICIWLLWRIMQHLVKAHWLLAEFFEVAPIQIQAKGQSFHELLRKRDKVGKIIHASGLECRIQSLRPNIWAVRKFPTLHLRVVEGQISGNVKPFFEIWDSIRLHRLAVQPLVPAVVIVLANVS